MELTTVANKNIILSGLIAIPLCTNANQAEDHNQHLNHTGSLTPEIIEVVAQKRKQNIQKVGVSVSAISAKMLSQLDITNTVDISQQIPSLQLSAWSPNLTIFNLRGVSQNSFTDNLEAPIAVYMDDTYTGSLNAISGQLFDMRRVEVLRGPQGTLFGRNATGGLIHYISRLADEDYTNGYSKVTFGSFNRRDIQIAYGNAINDNLNARIAINSAQADGYIESAVDDIRAIGGNDNLSFKVALQWQLSDDSQLDLLYKYSKDDDIPTGGYAFLPWTNNEIQQGYMPPELMNFTQNAILEGGEPPNGLSLLEFTQNVFFNTDDGFTPVDDTGRTLFTGHHSQPHQHFSNIDGYLNRTTDSITAKYSWDINTNTSFESISHYNSLDKSYLEDGDGIPAPIIAFQSDMDYRQISQEWRIAHQNQQLSWQAGLYYLDMKHDGLATTVGNPVIRLANSLIANGDISADYDPGNNAPQAIQDYLLNARNWSIFGQLEYNISEPITAIIGLRWSDDNKDLEYHRGFQDLTANIPLIEQGTVLPNQDNGTINYQDYAAKLQLNWQQSEQNLLFASYNRGIKVGNWAFSAGVPVDDLKHDPETLHSYEIGLKSTLAQNATTINATAFYYDYRNYQAFAMLGLAPQIRNSDATVKGAEIELSWQMTPQFQLHLGGAYLRSEVEQIDAVDFWHSPVGGTVIDFPTDVLYNLELPNAPRFSLNYRLRYLWSLSFGDLSAQLDGAYYDDQYLEVTNGGGSYQPAYAVNNLRLSFAPTQSAWQIDLAIKNLNNEIYKQYSLDLGMLGATAYYAPPRTTSLTVSYEFWSY